MLKSSHVTALLIRQFHQGYGMTHNSIRQAGYYIINGRSMISHIITERHDNQFIPQAKRKSMPV